MKSVGIDIGTTTISIVVMDISSLTVIRKYTIENNSFLTAEHPWERIQDVQTIIGKTRAALEIILSSFDNISAIGLTGQMHGIVYVDRSGKAVSPLYTWQDGRGNQPDFSGRSICDILAEDYGISAATGYGMVTYLYHCRNRLIPPNAASFCTIADYLGMELTGRTDPLIHISQAAGLGLYDHDNQVFLRDILVENGASPELVPQITSEMEKLGTFRGIPVSVSLGDNQASFLGSVRDGENTVLVNVGTGAQISVLSHHHYEGHGIEARPLSKDSYLLVGATICGGAAYAALEQFFRSYAAAAGAPDTPQFEVMNGLLEQQADPTQAWTVKTTFLGTRENPSDTGSISDIRIANFHPAALIRGTLNGMAKELYDLYCVLREHAGISRSKLVAAGNGVRRNEHLQSILSDLFALPITVEQDEEEAAFGAAISAQSMMDSVPLEQRLCR